MTSFSIAPIPGDVGRFGQGRAGVGALLKNPRPKSPLGIPQAGSVLGHAFLGRFALSRYLGLVFVGLLGISSSLGGPIDPANPPSGRFNDDWAEIFIGGNKSGYAHSTMTREGNLIRTGTTMRMKIDRAGHAVELGVIQETIETLEGVPVAFSSTMDLSVAKMTTRGTVKDGKVTLVASQFGMEQTQTFDFPKGAVMTWGAYRESINRGFKPCTQYEQLMYAPELRMDGPVKAKTRIEEWETFRHRGKEHRGQRVMVTMESPVGSMEMLSWIDDTGDPMKAKVPLPGIAEMEIVTTDQATALSDFVAPEIFMATAIKTDKAMDRAGTRQVKFRLRTSNAVAAFGDLPDTGMQKITSRSDQVVELTVARQSLPKTVAAKPTAELDEYLASNLLINKEDPVLIELAKKAADGETDPVALSDKLRRFVTDYVSAKSMNIGFATASEVARNKEGDCSEHAVLLTALGRLCGIPSRVVVGLAYAPFFGGQDNIYGYHMWTQFWIDGQWYDLDAALRETECNPGRIAFATSSLKDAGLADLSLALLNSMGAIRLDVLEVQPGNK